MSGGSLNYLCYKEKASDLLEMIDQMEKAEAFLIKRGYTDIAADVRRLIEYCKTASIRIEVLNENLNSIFHAVEWYISADYGDEDLIEALDKYREGKQ